MTTPTAEPVNSVRESKSDFVYQNLKEAISNGTFAPGAALYIRELSIQLNVSRTPVKEAISRLAFEGYVEVLPNRCAIVSRISAAETIELLELREYLERATAFYAAQRRTEQDIQELQQISAQHAHCVNDAVMMAQWDRKFHLAVAKAAYNRELYQVVEKVFSKLVRISLPISKDRLQASLHQHELILNSIKEGNADEARRHMAEHNQDILTSVKMFQYQNIHLFK